MKKALLSLVLAASTLVADAGTNVVNTIQQYTVNSNRTVMQLRVPNGVGTNYSLQQTFDLSKPYTTMNAWSGTGGYKILTVPMDKKQGFLRVTTNP